MNLQPIDNPPNPYAGAHREWLEAPPAARIEVYEETSGSILSRNDSPDIPFTWSVNPYRGCQHACAYCYARPYHEYLGFGAGTDFDTKLIVKTNAAALLRKAFAARRWNGETVNFSGITDCYQPLEASYQLTRACLQVCADHSNPAVIVTKSFLVSRDVDVLTDLSRRARVRVCFSIPFADAATSRLIEPQAPAPDRRFEAMRRLHDAGIPVGVIISPIIPGLNDRDIPTILRRAAEAGARSASYIPLRLPGSVKAVFLSRIAQVMPLRAKRIVNRLHEVRGGKLDESRIGRRMRGQGVYWQSIRHLFEISRHRYGLDGDHAPQPDPAAKAQTGREARDAHSGQMTLAFADHPA
ncbi:MAG: PA0069 family radical SAM protein [Phycisphaerae bacterium]